MEMLIFFIFLMILNQNISKDICNLNYGSLNSFNIEDKAEKEIEIGENSEIISSLFSYHLILESINSAEIKVKFNNEEIILNKNKNNFKKENITLKDNHIFIKSNSGKGKVSIIIDIPKDKTQYIKKNILNKNFEKEYVYFEIPTNKSNLFSNLIIENTDKVESNINLVIKKSDSNFSYFTDNDKKQIPSSFEFTLNNSEYNVIILKLNNPSKYIYSFSYFEIEKIDSYQNYSLILNNTQKYKILKYENNPIRANESKLIFQFQKVNFSGFYLYNNMSKIYFSEENNPINFINKSNELVNKYEYLLFPKGSYYILFYNSLLKNYFDYLYINNPGEQRELIINKTYYYSYKINSDQQYYFFKIPKNNKDRTLQLDFSYIKLSEKSDFNFQIYYWNSSSTEDKSIINQVTKNSDFPVTLFIQSNNDMYFKIYNSGKNTIASDLLDVVFFIYEGYNNIIDLSQNNRIIMPVISQKFHKKFFMDISNMNGNISFLLWKHNSLSNKAIEYKLNYHKNAKEGENETSNFQKTILQEVFGNNGFKNLSFIKNSNHTSMVIFLELESHPIDLYNDIPSFYLEYINNKSNNLFKIILISIIIVVIAAVIIILFVQKKKRNISNSDYLQMGKLENE